MSPRKTTRTDLRAGPADAGAGAGAGTRPANDREEDPGPLVFIDGFEKPKSAHSVKPSRPDVPIRSPIPSRVRAPVAAGTAQALQAAARLVDPSRPYSPADVTYLVGRSTKPYFEEIPRASFAMTDQLAILNPSHISSQKPFAWTSEKKKYVHFRRHRDLPIIEAARNLIPGSQLKSFYAVLAEKLLRTPPNQDIWGGIQRQIVFESQSSGKKNAMGNEVAQLHQRFFYLYRIVRLDTVNNLIATFDVHEKVVCTLHAINSEFLGTPSALYRHLGTIFTEDPSYLSPPLDKALPDPEKSRITIVTLTTDDWDEESEQTHEGA